MFSLFQKDLPLFIVLLLPYDFVTTYHIACLIRYSTLVFLSSLINHSFMLNKSIWYVNPLLSSFYKLLCFCDHIHRLLYYL
jgi:hypothetical protein